MPSNAPNVEVLVDHQQPLNNYIRFSLSSLIHDSDRSPNHATGVSSASTLPGSGGKTPGGGSATGSATELSESKKRGRSPSMYYSPGKKGEDSRRKKAATAAKSAAAKPKSGKIDKPKEKLKKVKTPDHPGEQKSGSDTKLEGGSPVVPAVTVQAALNRSNTADAPQPAKASEVAEQAQDGGEAPGGSSSDDSSEEPAKDDHADDVCPDVGGESLEQVRQRKAAHARYMRFSRSLQRTLVACYVTNMSVKGKFIKEVCLVYISILLAIISGPNSPIEIRKAGQCAHNCYLVWGLGMR